MFLEVVPPQFISSFQNRLCSLFRIAEEQIIFHALKPIDNEGLNLLSEASKYCQERFIEQIMQPSDTYEGQKQINYADVTIHLNEWITKFTVIAYLGLYEHVRTPLHEYFIYFPGKTINWRQLLLHFHINEKETKSFIFDVSEYIIEKIFSVIFYYISLEVFEKKDIFDEKISTILHDSDHKIIGLLNIANSEPFDGYLRHYYDASPKLIIDRGQEFTWRLRGEYNYFSDNGFPSFIPASIAERISLKEALRRLSDLINIQRISLKSLKQSMPDDQVYNYVAKIRSQIQKGKESPQTSKKKVQDSISNQVSPQITILPEHRSALANALEPYIRSNFDDLVDLLAGQHPNTFILFEGRPINALVYVFRQAFEAEYIMNTKSEVERWLAHWFRLLMKDSPKELSLSVIHDAMTKSKIPAKQSRIPYQP